MKKSNRPLRELENPCWKGYDMFGMKTGKDGKEVPKGQHTHYQMGEGPKHTYKCDYEGMEKMQKRITNGFRLFGKYYEGLWD